MAERERNVKVVSIVSDVEFYKTLQNVLFLLSAVCFFGAGYVVLTSDSEPDTSTISFVGISFSVAAATVMIIRMFLIRNLPTRIKKAADHE